MLIDIMFARDMYEVYEINGDCLITKSLLCSVKVTEILMLHKA